LYQYLKVLTGREANKLKNWRDIADWLEEAGYKTPKKRQDWGEAPEVSVFYGRDNELNDLKQWIVTGQCRLVAVLGMGGIGKTALAVQVARAVQDEFDYVVWRSLRNAPPLNELLADLLEFLPDQPETDLREKADKISLLMKKLAKHRCLVVLDQVEEILQAGHCAGRYRQGYSHYGELLTRVGQQNHQSCLLLLSREQPQSLGSLAEKTLPLKGLQPQAALKLGRARGLVELDGWERLTDRYSGNPYALNIIAAMIKEFFGGRVSQFIQNTLFLGDNLEYLLSQQFDRLPGGEKKIAYWLVVEWEPVSLSQLQGDMLSQISVADLMAELESLKRRSLIETSAKADVPLFTLPPLVRDYVKKQLRERVFQEVKQLLRQRESVTIDLLKTYDFYRSKHHQMMNHVKKGLGNVWKPPSLVEKLSNLLSNMKKDDLYLGYAEANIAQLQAEIQGELNE